MLMARDGPNYVIFWINEAGYSILLAEVSIYCFRQLHGVLFHEQDCVPDGSRSIARTALSPPCVAQLFLMFAFDDMVSVLILLE